MASPYFREGKHYSYSYLKKAFALDDEKLKVIINTLKRYSCLKKVLKNKPEYSELSDQDIVAELIEDSNDFEYIFNFVGVVLLNDCVIKCYPKYIDNENAPFEKLKTVLKVIEKYNSKEQLVHLYNGNDESKSFNHLALSLHILCDYYENGLYKNQIEVIEKNGDGEILWDKTINETFAFIKNSNPYYLDTYTHDNTENDFDYIRRLHECIVTKCTRDLSKGDVLNLFDLEGAELTEQTLDDFGDTDYIKYKIEKEIKTQFITQKQNLLKTLYTYVSKNKSNEINNSFSLYGTTSFNLVWEKACAAIFNSVYNESWTINRLAAENLISKNLVNDSNKNKKISDFIEKPDWKIGNESLSYDGDLVPDIITLKKTDSGNIAMYILDGKYYLLQVEKSNNKLSGNPGVQDVVKQYVYNASLRSFINKFQLGEIANAFLIPALESENIDKLKFADVPYWSMQKDSFKALPTIQVIKLRASDVWNCYLGGKIDLDKIWKSIKTSPTENYLYHNKNDNSIVKPNENKTHIVTGYLRQDYFNYIEKKIESSKASDTSKNRSFTFYFYATGKVSDSKSTSRKVCYPLHPYIDFCTKFIGYTSNKEKYIVGDLFLLNTDRCKIDEITAEDLQSELQKEGFTKTSSSAITYYKIKIENATIASKPHKNIASFAELKSSMNANGLNSFLYEYSPNVIDM